MDSEIRSNKQIIQNFWTVLRKSRHCETAACALFSPFTGEECCMGQAPSATRAAAASPGTKVLHTCRPSGPSVTCYLFSLQPLKQLVTKLKSLL